MKSLANDMLVPKVTCILVFHFHLFTEDFIKLFFLPNEPKNWQKSNIMGRQSDKLWNWIEIFLQTSLYFNTIRLEFD